MNASLIRSASILFFGFSMSAIAGSVQAATVCEEVYECREECTVNRKGVVKCNEVCSVTTYCYEDDGGGSGETYCITDQLTGEIVCLQP